MAERGESVAFLAGERKENPTYEENIIPGPRADDDA